MLIINGAASCVEVQGGADDPAVLLVGSSMLCWPDDNGAALAAEIPHAHLVRLDRAGHRLPPQAVPTIADELLAHTAGRGPRRN